MYIPKHNAQTERETLHGLIRDYPLGAWVTLGASGLVANHIPFLMDASRGPNGTLVGHVARANDVWKSFSTTLPSIVVFQGPQRYISPNWYPSRIPGGPDVPTWNYAVVHAHGTPRAIEDPEWLLQHVTQLMETHESREDETARAGDIGPAHLTRLLRAIVGIEIPVDSLVGKWKVSQNRSDTDKQGVVAALRAAGDDASLAMAALVERSAARGRV